MQPHVAALAHGTSLCGLSDVDRDGIDDYAVGSPGALGGAGIVQLYTGVALGALTVPLQLDVSRTQLSLSWGLATGCHDIVRGELDILLASDGDVASSLSACIADDVAGGLGPSVDEPGTNLYFVAREGDCPTAGSYDSGGALQLLPRDASINASVNACT